MQVSQYCVCAFAETAGDGQSNTAGCTGNDHRSVGKSHVDFFDACNRLFVVNRFFRRAVL